jgi:hypothetical protein
MKRNSVESITNRRDKAERIPERRWEKKEDQGLKTKLMNYYIQLVMQKIIEKFDHNFDFGQDSKLKNF